MTEQQIIQEILEGNGSKFKLFVPYNLGYYDRGPNPKVGPFSTLIYEIELISIDK